MRILLTLALVALTSLARADEPPPPPSFMAGKARTPDVEHKVQGWFTDELPLVAYDPNVGLGLGVGVHATLNGTRADPFFAYSPYRHRFYAQAYGTTGGYQQHLLTYEGLYVRDTPYRLKAVLTLERNTQANYFGRGEATLAPLSFQGHSYATYDEATSAAGPRYFHYGYIKPQGQVTIERGFWGGKIRTHYGLNVQHVGITRYDSPYAFAPTTKLGADCASGAATGCEGGWNNLLRSGIAFDTRDFEPDANSGVFIDLTGQWSSKGIGSSADYLRLTMAARFYYSPMPKLADLVLAGRVLYSIQSANVPFFALNTLAMAGSTDDATDPSGLGGERTLRGYRQDRFVGRVATAANAEIRWTFTKFTFLEKRFSLQVAPFVDAGRVFDKVALSFTDWRFAGGGGLRVGWNQSSIIMFDFGASREDTGFYIDFGMMF